MPEKKKNSKKAKQQNYTPQQDLLGSEWVVSLGWNGSIFVQKMGPLGCFGHGSLQKNGSTVHVASTCFHTYHHKLQLSLNAGYVGVFTIKRCHNVLHRIRELIGYWLVTSIKSTGCEPFWCVVKHVWKTSLLRSTSRSGTNRGRMVGSYQCHPGLLLETCLWHHHRRRPGRASNLDEFVKVQYFMVGIDECL